MSEMRKGGPDVARKGCKGAASFAQGRAAGTPESLADASLWPSKWRGRQGWRRRAAEGGGPQGTPFVRSWSCQIHKWRKAGVGRRWRFLGDSRSEQCLLMDSVSGQSLRVLLLWECLRVCLRKGGPNGLCIAASPRRRPLPSSMHNQVQSRTIQEQGPRGLYVTS